MSEAEVMLLNENLVELYDYIEMDRLWRLNDLKGKYIIILDSAKRGRLYIQRKEFMNGKYNWSQYKSNARPFKTKSQALNWMKQKNIRGEVVYIG